MQRRQLLLLLLCALVLAAWVPRRGGRGGTPVPVAPAVAYASTLAYEFNGTDERIDCGNVTTADGATHLKIAFWIRWVAGNQGWVIARRNTSQRQFGVLVLTTGQLRFYGTSTPASDAFVASNTLLSGGVWTHVIAEFDVSEPVDHARFYFDGVNDGSLGGSLGAYSNLSTPSVATPIYLADSSISGPLAMRLAHPAIWVGTNADSMVESEVYASASDPSEAPDLNNLSTTPPPDHWWPADSANLTSSGGVVDEGTGGANGTAANMDATDLVGVP